MYTKGLSVKRQGQYTDIAQAYCEVETIKSAMKCIHFNVDSFNVRVYNELRNG